MNVKQPVRHSLVLLLVFLVTACSQSELPAASQQSETQSAIDVKTQNSQISLQPLGTNQLLDKAQPSLRTVAELYASKASHVQTEDSGTVVKLLPDDTLGLRHQRFLVKVASGQTLLFAHNIDLSSRIVDIKVGDQIDFRGEYIYNPKGGIVHWTHHDPQGKHYAGWLKHNGRTYD
ncbi:MAG: DUF3465 domain-containing protein [Pseudomonadota bacterium]